MKSEAEKKNIQVEQDSNLWRYRLLYKPSYKANWELVNCEFVIYL